jgi:UDP-N-acetylglucosamine diphosphorylase/glucosamine-1-phosphate N-acetyltransferase
MKLGEKYRCSAIILAAGKGKRMKSDTAKVLHTLCGKPMLAFSIDVAKAMGVEKTVVIIGHQGHAVRQAFQQQGLIFVEQREQLGTGHAVIQASEVFRQYKGAILILCGDVPLLQAATVRNLFERHIAEEAVVTVLTTILENPYGYGRIVKGCSGNILKIVEEKDATTSEKEINEINTGIYCVQGEFLFDAIEKIGNNNAQKEYYLTDMVEAACRRGVNVVSMIAPNPIEVMGINTPEDLQRASGYMEREATGIYL